MEELIPEFYVKSNGNVICIPTHNDEDELNKSFKCHLVNIKTLSGVLNNQEVIITSVMNGKTISHVAVKNGSIVTYTNPIYRRSPPLPVFTIFQHEKEPASNDVRLRIHTELNSPDYAVKKLTIQESVATEQEIWDFIAAQDGSDHSVFIPDGVILRIPVREILKIYSAALPVSLIMPKTFYYYDRTSDGKRYVTLPSFAYSKPIISTTDITTRSPWTMSQQQALTTTFLQQTSSTPPVQTIDTNTQVIIIGAAVFFFISLILGFILMYWFYTFGTY